MHITSCFAEAARLFGLDISLKKKTDVFYQPAPQEVYHHPHVTIGGTELKTVYHFNYISMDAKEVDNRLEKQAPEEEYKIIVMTTLIWYTVVGHLRLPPVTP